MSPDLEAEMERRVRAGESAWVVIDDVVARGAVASRKQPLRTLEKWSARGRWDYGTSIGGGWFTDAHPRGSNLDANGHRPSNAPRAMRLAFEGLRPSGDPQHE